MLMDEPQAEIETRGDSAHITPPSGRSYYAPVGEKVDVCPACNGEGHHDSCFDCGNRGYNIDEQFPMKGLEDRTDKGHLKWLRRDGRRT